MTNVLPTADFDGGAIAASRVYPGRVDASDVESPTPGL
jgi:hypothetical protein